MFPPLHLKLEPLFHSLYYVFVVCELIGLRDQILPKLRRNSSWILLKILLWAVPIVLLICFLGQSIWLINGPGWCNPLEPQCKWWEILGLKKKVTRVSLTFFNFCFCKCSLKCFAYHITLWLVSVPLVWHLHALEINKKARHAEAL